MRSTSSEERRCCSLRRTSQRSPEKSGADGELEGKRHRVVQITNEHQEKHWPYDPKKWYLRCRRQIQTRACVVDSCVLSARLYARLSHEVDLLRFGVSKEHPSRSWKLLWRASDHNFGWDPLRRAYSTWNRERVVAIILFDDSIVGMHYLEPLTPNARERLPQFTTHDALYKSNGDMVRPAVDIRLTPGGTQSRLLNIVHYRWDVPASGWMWTRIREKHTASEVEFFAY